MEEPAYIAIFVTTATAEEAQRISSTLLDRRKVTCVNIVPGVSSFFRWQGKLDSTQESLLIIKTKASLLNEVVRLVKEVHSYAVPEVIALPIVGGNPDYLDWIGREAK